MKKSDFSYYLPERLIAQTPLERRDQSRLMVLSRESGQVAHRQFYNLKEYLRAGDCLVLNDTRVLPARLYGIKESEGPNPGAAVEVLLLRQMTEDRWECIVHPGRRLREGARVSFGEGQLNGEVAEVLGTGNRVIHFRYQGVFLERLEQLGSMPLPPYIKERLIDGERYQTVYAKHPGSAAAPTAGLHFTPQLLDEIEAMGIQIARLTLHVGLGTLRPVKADDILEHVMHTEQYLVSTEAADTINQARRAGGRAIAVGTTSCRTLESVADEEGIIRPGNGETNIFIYPGYRFKVVDGLVTNFHLPESTLMMLISALTGRERILAAYRRAVEENLNFFSYGDAMLIK